MQTIATSSGRARSASADVREQAGVAEVVDGLAAEVDHEPGGRVRRCRSGVVAGVPRRHEPHPAAVELDGAADVRVGHVLEPLLAELVRQLDDRDHLRAGALGDVHDVAVVVGVAVRQEDVRRARARTPRPRPSDCRSGTGRRARACRRPSARSRRGPGSGCPRSVSSGVAGSFQSRLAELPAHGHADKHAHARLLGEQRPTRAARAASSGSATAERSSDWCASPNQPPSSSAWVSTRWSCGAAAPPAAPRPRSARGRTAPAPPPRPARR